MRDHATDAQHRTPGEAVKLRVLSMLAAAHPVQCARLTPDTPFAAADIDVWDVVLLCMEVETAFGIEIPDPALNAILTPLDLVDAVTQALALRDGAAR